VSTPQLEGAVVAPDTLSPLRAKEGYERWALLYDQGPNPVVAREERYLASLLPSLHGKHVLDLACGTGRWLEKVLAYGAKLGVGVDFSHPMLHVASRKSSIQGRLAQADCLELPFRPSLFDFAICSFALGHIQNLRKLVCELASVMKRGAEVLVSDLHPEAYARGWRTGFRNSQSAVQIEVFPRISEEIIRTFYSGGFECLTHISLCLGEADFCNGE
jgi:ubiquinone/menaquinone biosynthesis C-methylase UbiE